jgi:hypothetical protein
MAMASAALAIGCSSPVTPGADGVGSDPAVADAAAPDRAVPAPDREPPADQGSPRDTLSDDVRAPAKDAGATPDAGAGPNPGLDAGAGPNPGLDAGAGPAPGFWDTAVDGGPSWSGTSVAGTVAVNRSMIAGRIGRSFLGLSFEKSHMTDAFFTGKNAPLIALFKLLGPCVLRIGANDADRTTWDPNATPVAPGTIGKTVGTVAVDDLGAFLKATGWEAIYAVNLETAPPANSAAEAKYAADKLGASLYGFELGNEINLYGLPYDAVKARWGSLAAAIRAVAPNAPLVGPATNPSGLQSVFVPFARDEASKVILLSHHYYRGSGGASTSTMDKLLSPDPGLIKVLQTLSTAATTNHVRDGYRLAETASFSSHGAPGVSDALGSALWALDFFFDNARNGSSGINFHGGGLGMDGNRPFYYAPIGEAKSAVTEAKPLFYGMLLMALAGTGNVLATTAAAGGLNFTAHALAQADGSINVVLVNKDATTGVRASVELGAPIARASVVYLEGPSLGATSGVKVAGAGISPTGVWSHAPPWALAAGGSALTVVVPPGSAALVHAR